MHGARNLNPVITLKNLLPPGRGPMLRDGPALAIPYRMVKPARQPASGGKET